VLQSLRKNAAHRAIGSSSGGVNNSGHYAVSHRHAAAGVRSVKQRLQRLAARISASIGPEGIRRHEARLVRVWRWKLRLQ
jgi:hypothetical protein